MYRIALSSFMVYLFLAWVATQLLFSLLKQTGVWNPRRLPPGPFALPVLGNLFSLGKMPYKSLAEIAKHYGPLASLQLGSLTTVVISSPFLAQKMFQEHDAVFAHRQIRHTTTISGQHLSSVVFLPPSPRWRFLRKICTSHVFATSRLDAGRDLRRKVVQELLTYAEECCTSATPMNINRAAFTTSLNILSNTFFSMDLANLRSGTGHELKELVSTLLAEGGTPNITDCFPVLRLVDPQGIHRRSTVLKERILEVFDDIVKTRMQQRKETGSNEDKDVLDALLTIYEENDNFGLAEIRIMLLDLFVAGTETTSSTIEWAMSELVYNIKKMKKAQAELDQVIGKGNLVENSDVDRLPYLRAIIKETLRLHPPVPFLVPRKVSTDVEFCNFVIPKNAQVWINVWAIGRDERVWENANCFEPERFLDLQIDYKGQNFELIPFGSGRRICLGLPLAHRVLHLVLGSLISSFDWKLQQSDKIAPEELDMSERFGITLQKAQPLCVVPIHR